MALGKKAVRRRERRVSTRVDARLSMRVEGSAEGAVPKIVTESQNISASGVYCTSSQYLSPLSKVLLTIVLPRVPGATRGQELIKCEGIVVRCESAPSKRSEPRYDLACMFAEVDERRRDLLEAFVTWRNLQALRAAVAPPAARKKAVVRRAVVAPARRVAARRAPARAARRPAGAKRTAR